MSAEQLTRKPALGRFAPSNVLYHARRKALVSLGRSYVRRMRPDIERAIAVFEAAGFRQGWTQIDRLIDLEHLLARHRPKTITELGSGLSTVVFALYAHKTPGVNLVTFEENADWIELTTRAMRAAGAAGPSPKHVEKVMLAGTDGCHYAQPVPSNTDFLYIDGPANSLSREVSVPCLDVLKAWQAGLRATIAIDLRFSTIDAMRADPAARDYQWAPSRRYQQHNAIAGGSARIGPHTIARAKST